MQQPKQKQRTIAKRSACDRCREHKLRCSRSQGRSDHEPCIRCVRARTSCVTGAPRIVGRPRITDCLDTHAPEISASPVSDSGLESAAEAVSSSTEHGPVNFSHLLAIDSDMTDMFFDEELNTPIRNPGCHDGTICLPELIDSPSQQSYNTRAIGLSNDMHHQPEISSLAMNIFDPPLNDDLQIQHLPYNAFDNTSRSPSSLLGPDNVLNRLARLNNDLACQLPQLDSTAWQIPTTALVQTCVDKIHDKQSNPLASVLEKTSEFATILKQIISPIQDHGTTPLTMPAVLMCLSSHIQLLQIFNSIFAEFVPLLSRIPDIIGFFEAAPGISHVGGLPPVKGHLYLKIVVQIIEHEVATVERLIGLPPELCLSGHRALTNSLFSLVDSPGLLQAAMTQACSISEQSGKALVMTLRENLDKILGLLVEEC